jgi:hypothetical protein
LITEYNVLQKDIKGNIAQTQNSEETPKHNLIEENNEKDLPKYAGYNLIYSLDGSKNCIIKTSEALLKTIFGINEEEKRNFFLGKFKEGMGLLQKTKLKRFQGIDIDNLIKTIRDEVNQQKENRLEINSRQLLRSSEII